MKAHTADAIRQMSEAFTHELPDALFLLVPGLALALSLLYHGGNHYYAEHLVFALHFQAFSFAALTIGLIRIPLLDGLVFVSILTYLYLALCRVYGEGRAVTVGKTAFIVVGYGVSMAIIMAAVGFVVFLFA